MISYHACTTRGLLLLAVVTAAAMAAGCSTVSGAQRASSADPAQETEYLNVAETRKDFNRIICRRHESNGSSNPEKICMTARQWQQASDDASRTLDRAQRASGDLDGN